MQVVMKRVRLSTNVNSQPFHPLSITQTKITNYTFDKLPSATWRRIVW